MGLRPQLVTELTEVNDVDLVLLAVKGPVTVCSGGVLRKILNKQRLTFEDIKLRADVTRNEASVNEITDIHIHFTIIGSQISDEKLEKAFF